MAGILLDFLYGAGLVALSPVWLYRMIRHGRYREGIAQRFGAAPIRYGLQPVIWVHGVSMGEVNAARAIVAELHSQLPDYRVAISSTTDTGMAAARRLFAPDHIVFHWPLDFSLAVRRALDRMRPDLVVLMEGEVWPNFLAACNRRNVPVVVVNARMSPDKGYPRYKKLGRIATRMFNRLTAIGAQDESYAQRFLSLGVKPEKVRVTGMIKFDTAEVADRVEGQEALAAALGIGPQDKLIVAGGTGPGEEEMLLKIFGGIKAHHPEARLAIVPRKPERFDEVAKLITAAGFPLVRRSERPDARGDSGLPTPYSPLPTAHSQPPVGSRELGVGSEASRGPVFLGDTMGELRKFYGLARCIFVGRSLVPMGGSDMIEAAALGKPTAFGPHTFNFPQADDLAANGCARVTDAEALSRQLEAWLADPVAAQAAGRKVQDYIRTRQGATRKNVEMICRILGREPGPPGAIATEALR
ncbi:MAG: 3-deoxy-D-manno-octulosonic acid transferase [Phycisphaerae bacterium]